MKKIVFSLLALITVCCLHSCDFIGNSLKENPAAGKIPEPTNEYVNDYAKIFTEEEINDLTERIDDLYKNKGVQILVVTTPDLGDYTISDYAQRTGDKWGVGGSAEDKGVVIIIKPKNETKGEAFIATGYGLEEFIPDVRCKEIVSDLMVPSFKEDKYHEAVVNAVEYIGLLVK